MKTLLPTLAAAAAATVQLAAAPFQYSPTNFPPDLMIGLRKSGAPSEIVVDLGPVSRFRDAAPGATIPIPEFTAAQFGGAFGSSDGVGFAVFSAVRTDGDAATPFQTIWVSRRRTDPSQQSVPWRRQGAGTLGITASRIASIGSGAATFSAGNKPSDANTATAVVLPASNANGYTTYFGSGNFKGTFQGNAENVAPSDFSTLADPVVSDLYEIAPGTGDAAYVGYFEFTPAGTMTFHAPGGQLPLPAPRITGVARDGATTTVTIGSEAGGRYQLLRAPAGVPWPAPGAWTPVGAAVVATGTTLQLTASGNDDTAVYAVSGTR